MMDRLLPRLCVGLGIALAGCTPPVAEWSPAQAPKALHVDFVRLQHAAAFVHGSAELAGGEAAKLGAFLERSAVGPDDHVFIELAPGDRLAAARIGRLAKELDRRGFGVETIPAPTDVVPGDHAVVLVERYVVTPPACPDWTKIPDAEHANALPSNFGCADKTNLGLMVADPRDLVIGRKLGPLDAGPATQAIARYRAGKPKPPPTATAQTTYSAPSQQGGGGGGGGGGEGGADAGGASP